MAYSPFSLMPIFWAIMEFSASVIKIRPCQLLLKLEMPHCGQLSVSTNNLQRLHTFFFAMGFYVLIYFFKCVFKLLFILLIFSLVFLLFLQELLLVVRLRRAILFVRGLLDAWSTQFLDYLGLCSSLQ